MGPCRLVGKTTRGVCGATRVHGGGAQLCPSRGRRRHRRTRTMGAAWPSRCRPWPRAKRRAIVFATRQKLQAVAGYLDIPTQGRQDNEIALDVAQQGAGQLWPARGRAELRVAGHGQAPDVVEGSGPRAARDRPRGGGDAAPHAYGHRSGRREHPGPGDARPRWGMAGAAR